MYSSISSCTDEQLIMGTTKSVSFSLCFYNYEIKEKKIVITLVGRVIAFKKEIYLHPELFYIEIILILFIRYE